MNNQMPYYFRMFVALAYIFAGLYVLTTKYVENRLESKEMSMIFGALLLIYGLFRGYRNQKSWDKPNRE